MTITNTMLKIKIKNLADEARTIRKEEQALKASGRGHEISKLREHRVLIVRAAARQTLLAYGFLRNIPYEKLESNCKTEPNWKAVEKMIVKYGNEGLINDFNMWRSVALKKAA